MMTLSSGQPFFYVEAGKEKEKLLICIHGLTKNSDDFHHLFTSHLSNYYHIVALDLKGHGRTKEIISGYGYPQLCAEIKEFILQFNKQHITFMGHSWGADLAIYLTTKHSLVPRRIILLDGGYVNYYGMISMNDQGNVTIENAYEKLSGLPAPQIECIKSMVSSRISKILPLLKTECFMFFAGIIEKGMESLVHRHRQRFIKLVPQAEIFTLQGVNHDQVPQQWDQISKYILPQLIEG